MANDRGPGEVAPRGDDSARGSRGGTYWIAAALVGLVVGWIGGIAIRPDAHQLFDAAMALVPESAVVIETTDPSIVRPNMLPIILVRPAPTIHVKVEAPLTLYE